MASIAQNTNQTQNQNTVSAQNTNLSAFHAFWNRVKNDRNTLGKPFWHSINESRLFSALGHDQNKFYYLDLIKHSGIDFSATEGEYFKITLDSGQVIKQTANEVNLETGDLTAETAQMMVAQAIAGGLTDLNFDGTPDEIRMLTAAADVMGISYIDQNNNLVPARTTLSNALNTQSPNPAPASTTAFSAGATPATAATPTPSPSPTSSTATAVEEQSILQTATDIINDLDALKNKDIKHTDVYLDSIAKMLKEMQDSVREQNNRAEHNQKGLEDVLPQIQAVIEHVKQNGYDGIDNNVVDLMRQKVYASYGHSVTSHEKSEAEKFDKIVADIQEKNTVTPLKVEETKEASKQETKQDPELTARAVKLAEDFEGMKHSEDDIKREGNDAKSKAMQQHNKDIGLVKGRLEKIAKGNSKAPEKVDDVLADMAVLTDHIQEKGFKDLPDNVVYLASRKLYGDLINPNTTYKDTTDKIKQFDSVISDIRNNKIGKKAKAKQQNAASGSSSKSKGSSTKSTSNAGNSTTSGSSKARARTTPGTKEKKMDTSKLGEYVDYEEIPADRGEQNSAAATVDVTPENAAPSQKQTTALAVVKQPELPPIEVVLKTTQQGKIETFQENTDNVVALNSNPEPLTVEATVEPQTPIQENIKDINSGSLTVGDEKIIPGQGTLRVIRLKNTG